MLQKLEYIWLDGNEKMQGLRSKIKTLNIAKFDLQLSDCPTWSFDGSSTGQASGNFSDCLLKPVFMRKYYSSHFVFCEVLNSDGSPHVSNARAAIEDDNKDYWFGFEQEYFLWNPKTNQPLGYQQQKQGQFYCSVGAKNAFGRKIAEEHLDKCIECYLNIEGINAEVAPGQWEFQIFAHGAKEAGDQLWLARYILEKIAEKYEVAINWHCKPCVELNGSGNHTNVSNSLLRTCGDKETFDKICQIFGTVTKEHLAVYGYDNHLRLTGQHETASLNQFSYGVSDRGASIRIPIATVQNGWKGWIEDRRPNSSSDPYKVTNRIIQTLKMVE